jgi:hypothetical protein
MDRWEDWESKAGEGGFRGYCLLEPGKKRFCRKLEEECGPERLFRIVWIVDVRGPYQQSSFRLTRQHIIQPLSSHVS